MNRRQTVIITFLRDEGLRFFGVSLSFPLLTLGADESRTFFVMLSLAAATDVSLTGTVEEEGREGGGGGRATVPAVIFLTSPVSALVFDFYK